MTVAVARVLNPLFGQNTYVVRASEQAAEAVVVDPGGDPEPLLELGTTVAAILVTHTDLDHVLGVADLHRATGAEVWVPAGEADVLRTGAARAGGGLPPHDPEHLVSDGDVVRAAGLELEVVGTPGHSVDHVAYCVDGALFSGDGLPTTLGRELESNPFLGEIRAAS